MLHHIRCVRFYDHFMDQLAVENNIDAVWFVGGKRSARSCQQGSESEYGRLLHNLMGVRAMPLPFYLASTSLPTKYL